MASRTRFKRLVHVDSCSSTQDLAQRDAGSAPGVFWAEHQTAGRGRHGRDWSDCAGLDVAVTFRVSSLSIANPIWLAAAVPLSVLKALEPRTGERLTLKWPNDLLLGGRKISGILMDTLGQSPETYLLGIGINVNRTEFPSELSETATSLALATGQETERWELVLELAVQVDDTLDQLERNERAPLEDLFGDRLGLLNRMVTLRAGTSTHRGRMVQLDFEGLTLDDGTTVPLGLVQSIVAGSREE